MKLESYINEVIQLREENQDIEKALDLLDGENVPKVRDILIKRRNENTNRIVVIMTTDV